MQQQNNTERKRKNTNEIEESETRKVIVFKGKGGVDKVGGMWQKYDLKYVCGKGGKWQ